MWALLFRCRAWAWTGPRGPTQDDAQPCTLPARPGRAAGCGLAGGRSGGGGWEERGWRGGGAGSEVVVVLVVVVLVLRPHPRGG